jgi:hypothetical protein
MALSGIASLPGERGLIPFRVDQSMPLDFFRKHDLFS